MISLTRDRPAVIGNTRGQFFCVVLVRYNTRAWELNGHTMVELLGVVDEKEIEGLLSYGLDENYFPVINRTGR